MLNGNLTMRPAPFMKNKRCWQERGPLRDVVNRNTAAVYQNFRGCAVTSEREAPCRPQ
jgi:hypothetical protein